MSPLSPEDHKELITAVRRLVRKTILRTMPKILDAHASRRERFEKEAVAYPAAVFAFKVGKTLAQVHEWFREGQVIAKKLDDSRAGSHGEWRIAHAELRRYQAEGLYPLYSIETFARELVEFEKNSSLATLCKLVESCCINGEIRAKECPHGWRIGSLELKRYLFERGFIKDMKIKIKRKKNTKQD